ncbi:MAG: hypothetical protein QXO07_01565 [Candidatus Aenigmatarchaeota archaeon]
MNIKSVNILLILFTLIVTLFISFSENDYIESRLELNLNRGWNLISIPFEKYKIEYNDCQIRSIFSYESREWKRVNINNLEPGKGYFIRVNNSCKIVISGTIKTDLETVIKLDRGWNLIGVISPIPVGYILDRHNVSKIYVFENGQWRELKENDLLEPGKGYFIRATATEEIQISFIYSAQNRLRGTVPPLKVECQPKYIEAKSGERVRRTINCECIFSEKVYSPIDLEIRRREIGTTFISRVTNVRCDENTRRFTFEVSFEASRETTILYEIFAREYNFVVEEVRVRFVGEKETKTSCKIECDLSDETVMSLSSTMKSTSIQFTCRCSGCDNERISIRPISPVGVYRDELIRIMSCDNRGFGGGCICSKDGTSFTSILTLPSGEWGTWRLRISAGNTVIEKKITFIDDRCTITCSPDLPREAYKGERIYSECVCHCPSYAGVPLIVEYHQPSFTTRAGVKSYVLLPVYVKTHDGRLIQTTFGGRTGDLCYHTPFIINQTLYNEGEWHIRMRAGSAYKEYKINVKPRECNLECTVPSEAYVGDTVNIECRCGGRGCDKSVIVRITSQPPGLLTMPEGIGRGACSVERRPISASFTPNKEGTWTIIATAYVVEYYGLSRTPVEEPITERSYTINVRPKPQPQCNIECTVPSTARVGDTVNIECRCSGCDGNVVIRYFKPRSLMSERLESGTCTISGSTISGSLTLDREGTWTITASVSRMGIVVADRSYTINVQSQPQPQPQPQCNLVCRFPSEAYVGESALIECTCSGCDERVVISYSGPGGSGTIREDRCSREGKRITELFTPDREGTWTIRATAGNAERTGTVDVKSRQCNLECRFPSEAYVGDTVNIECTCSGCIEKVVISYFGPGGSGTSRDDASCVLLGRFVSASFTPDRQGTWTIIAKAGNAERTGTINVKPKPQPQPPHEALAIAPIVLNLKKGWNLISNPTDLEISIEDLRNFGCSVRGSFIYYDPETREWKRTTKMLPDDKGYFVYLNNECTIYLSPSEKLKERELKLSRGWNLINGLDELTCKDLEKYGCNVRIRNNNCFISYIDGSWKYFGITEKGRGYWIYCE